MWAILPNEDYVANPAKGSRHNRGAAVDLTLIDSLGNELDMGTGYDDFTKKANRDYPDLPEQTIKNRKVLDDAMIKFGFDPMRRMWQFDFTGWSSFLY